MLKWVQCASIRKEKASPIIIKFFVHWLLGRHNALNYNIKLFALSVRKSCNKMVCLRDALTAVINFLIIITIIRHHNGHCHHHHHQHQHRHHPFYIAFASQINSSVTQQIILCELNYVFFFWRRSNLNCFNSITVVTSEIEAFRTC